MEILRLLLGDDITTVVKSFLDSDEWHYLNDNWKLIKYPTIFAVSNNKQDLFDLLVQKTNSNITMDTILRQRYKISFNDKEGEYSHSKEYFSRDIIKNIGVNKRIESIAKIFDLFPVVLWTNLLGSSKNSFDNFKRLNAELTIFDIEIYLFMMNFLIKIKESEIKTIKIFTDLVVPGDILK